MRNFKVSECSLLMTALLSFVCFTEILKIVIPRIMKISAIPNTLTHPNAMKRNAFENSIMQLLPSLIRFSPLPFIMWREETISFLHKKSLMCFCFVVMFRYHKKMRDINLAMLTLPVLFHVNASAACDWLLTTTGLQQDIQASPSLRQLQTADHNGCSSFKHLLA